MIKDAYHKKSVLDFLIAIDDQIGKLKALDIPMIGLYFEPILDTSAAVKKSLHAGHAYGEELVKLLTLFQRMHWKFFAAYGPFIFQSLKRWHNLKLSARKGPMVRAQKQQPKYLHCKFLKSKYHRKTISSQIRAIRRYWAVEFGTGYKADTLAKRPPPERTIRRIIESDFPERLKRDKGRASSRAFMHALPPTWDDILKFSAALNITIEDPERLRKLYKKHPA